MPDTDYVSRDQTLAALVGIYQAERADCTGILNISFALVAAALAYIGFTLGIGDGLAEWGNSGAVFLLPIPLLMLATSHALIWTLSAVRGTASKAVEQEILARCQQPLPRESIAGSAGERVMAFPQQKYALKFASGAIFGGEFSVVIAYTVFCWITGFQGTSDQAWKWTIAGIAYIAMFAIMTAALISGFRLISEIDKELAVAKAEPGRLVSPDEARRASTTLEGDQHMACRCSPVWPGS